MTRHLYLLLFLFSFNSYATHEPWVKTEFPQDIKKQWWDEQWWQNGKLDSPDSFEVSTTEIDYPSGDADIDAFIFRPVKPGNYPAVLFQHGRRGLDDMTILAPKRLAARGFVVLAPDVYSGRFFEPFPMDHKYVNDKDVAKAIDVLLELPGIKGDKACIVSHTRGGYMALKAVVTYKKQVDKVSCYVSFYPHWQDPNDPEPMQVYQYAPEINKLEIPVMVFMGEHEQYQRLRPIMEGIKALQDKGKDAELYVYPGVGRGFDFRPAHVRTFADDLATKDAIRRTELFIRKHLNTP